MFQIQIYLSRSILYLWLTLSLTNSEKPPPCRSPGKWGKQRVTRRDASLKFLLHLFWWDLIDLVLSLKKHPIPGNGLWFSEWERRCCSIQFTIPYDTYIYIMYIMYICIYVYMYIWIYIYMYYIIMIASLCQNNKLLASWAFTQRLQWNFPCEQWKKPWLFGFIWGIILPSYIGIIIKQYKDPY